MGDELQDRNWDLAQLGVAHGGLGIRDPVRHAGAAYLASVTKTQELSLRLQIFNGSGVCPCCGDPMDQWGDHALVCSCNGDRTVRHNAVRNVTHEEANEVALNPEREKAGLLPVRPASDGIATSGGARRPADIWFPRGVQGDPEALDFAVTSGLRGDLLHQVIDQPETVFERYERFKKGFKQTEQHCRDQGLCFTPMILEAHGGGGAKLSGESSTGWPEPPQPHIMRSPLWWHSESPNAFLFPCKRKTRGRS